MNFLLINVSFILLYVTGNDVFRKYDIISTEVLPVPINKAQTISECGNSSCKYLVIEIEGVSHEYCLFTRDFGYDLTSIQTQIEFENKSQYYSQIPTNQLVSGAEINEPIASFLKGYIYRNRFFGEIQMKDKRYYIERVSKYPDIMIERNVNNRFLGLIFEQSDYITPEGVTDYFGSHDIGSRNSTLKRRSKRKAQKSSRRNIGKICTILLTADNTYFYKVADGNPKLATMEMMTYLNEAEAMFRITDFDQDGISDNIGFRVKYISILNGKPIDPKKPLNPMHPNDYLFSVSYQDLLEDVCLGVTFTAIPFPKNIIGASFTAAPRSDLPGILMAGGICEMTILSGEHLNIVAITTFINETKKLPSVLIELALAHEIGHSFGSLHDPDTTNCKDHLMSSLGGHDITSKSYKFSECSKKEILNILKSRGAYCLEYDAKPYCGNTIVEDGEDCDCGLLLDCVSDDSCCYPRGSGAKSCHVNFSNGAECHPSQGYCCKSDCKFRNLDHIGIHCKEPVKICPCQNSKKLCSCGYFGECVSNTCHSVECTRLGLTECACKESRKSRCETCCQVNETECISSKIASTSVLQNVTVFNNVENHEKLFDKVANMEEKTFCFGERCLNLTFSFWNAYNYCVHYGEIGYCSGNGKCNLLDRSYKILPEQRSAHKSLASKNSSIRRSDLIFNILRSILVVVAFRSAA